jgi:uncharacterized protein (DUF4213/DUF364 family)
LTEKSARELVQMVHNESILEAAVGMAAINSLLDVAEDRCVELNGRDLIAAKGTGKRIAIVGHFPFIPQIHKLAKELWVIEKNPHEGDFSENEAANLIPRAEVVCITGTAFTNHTIDRLIGLCDTQAYVVILGDTTPLSPLLFDHGVDALAGTKVVNSEQALRAVSEGANYRQIMGIRQLTMTKS